MNKIKKQSGGIILLCCVLLYYILFFTRLLNEPMRQVTYLLSGQNTALQESIFQSRAIEMHFQSSQGLFQYYYTTLLSQLQFGPYMNFTVYIFAFFSITPAYLFVMLILRERREKVSFDVEQRYWRLFTQNFINYLVFASLISGVGSVLSRILATLFQAGTTPANQIALQNNLKSNFFISIVPIIFLAPIIEEIIFRGILLSAIKRVMTKLKYQKLNQHIAFLKRFSIQLTWAEGVAIIVSSIFFAAIHLTSGSSQWIYFPAYFFGGLGLGAIYVYNKERLYASIVVHAVYNALPILLNVILHKRLGG